MAWKYTGGERPPFADEPGPGQESCWDYPRPPVCVDDDREVVVRAGGREIARSSRAVRVLETASPPTFYLPPEEVDLGALRAAAGTSWCEWKGAAAYWDVRDGEGWLSQAAWSYPSASERFAAIAGWLAFYPGRVTCEVAGERVRPQPGQFYGGWVTDDVVGPFKGGGAGGAGW